ncbi:MAG: DUF4011 domain-containing protein, partial [Myxococcota bacterium]
MTTERAVEVEPTIAVRVDVSVRRVVNLATASCGVPIVDAVRLENLGPARIVGARWYGALDPHGASISVPLPTVHPGEEVTVAPIGLELSAERLAAVRQAEPARLDWWIGVDRREIARGDAVVDVLPFDEWPGDRAPPGVLAAFVLPDDPVVATLVRRIDGRATEPGRPSARIEALCDSIRALGIRATEPPASFEQRGLRLRLPDAILRDQKANRVELGLLIASCLERMGIPPLVVSSAGRLLPGAWLGDERFPEGVVLDAVRLRAAAASDQLVVLDPELGLADPTVPAAVRAGPEALDDAAFRFAIDIRVARGDHWRPLVGRPRPDLRDDGTVRPIVREILAEAATLPVQAPVRPGEGAVDEPVAARFRQWKERLLDLSLRNRLLAFRSTAKTTVPLDVPDLARFVDRLLADAVLAVEPRRGVFDGEPTEVDDGLGDAPTEEATAPTAPRAIPAATEPLPVAATAPDANDANDDLDETTDRMDPIPPDPDDSTVVAKAVYRRGHVDEGELVEASDAGELVDPELPTAATDTMVTATLATATMSTGTMSTGTMSTATMTPGTMATATMAPATSVPDPSDVDADVGRPRTRLDRGAVHAELDETELLARVVALDRATRLDLEEGGANTLYAAVGFLQWSESGPGEATRLAPLLLIPVSLELQRTARRVRIRRAPEDPIANVTLVEKLRRDFDVDLSAIVAFESEDHAMDVTAVLAAARAAIAPIKGWRIVERVALGQLLFTKFLVWRDLEDNAGWLLESPVVQHLARRVHGPYPNPVDATSPTELDDLVPPQVLPLVLDADSTQMAAIHSALQGRSFVLQGPPGTGKSQTIANLVAVAIATGRTVLVVAEKMAALEVVHRRLKEVGLGEYCLELHSHKANKRAVVATLAAALKRELSASAPPWDARSAELGELRTQLDAYVRALHAGRALGATFFETTGRMLAARSAQVGVGRLELPDDDPRSGGPLALTDDRWRATVDCAAMFATAAAEVEPIADHPWADSRAATWSASGEQAVLARLAKASEATDAVEQAGAALAELHGASVPDVGARIVDLAALATTLAEGPLPPPATDPRTAGPFAERVHEFASLYATWQARSRSVATRWHPGIYKVPLERLVARFGSWAYTWFPIAWLGLFFARRELRAHARKGLPDNRTIAADLNLALQIEQMREPLANQRKALLTAAAGTWSGDEAAGVGALTALTDRADKVRDQIRRVRLGGTDLTDQVLQFVDPALPPDRRKLLAKRAGDATRTLEKWTAAVASLLDAVDAVPTEIPHDEQPFAEIRARLARWRDGAARFRGWALYGEAAARMDNAGLAPVVEAHRGGALAAAAVPAVVEASVLGRWIDAVRDAEPALRGFAGPEHHRKVGRFRAIDQQHLELGVAQVAWAVAQRVPRVGAEVADTSEPGILLREAAKKTRQKSIRRLFQEIPNLLARLEPCLLMSPLSVAQYLPAGGRRFDLVVFDEASQIGTHDAIGALARGGQVVVVGDSRQLR